MDAIWGIHAVREALESGRPIQHVHFQQGLRNPRLSELMDQCRRRNIPLRFDPAISLDRLAEGGHHQGVVAIAAGTSMLNWKMCWGERRKMLCYCCWMVCRTRTTWEH